MKPGTRVRVIDLDGALNGYEATVLDPVAFARQWGKAGQPLNSSWTVLVDFGFDDPEPYWFAEDELEVLS